MRNSLPGAIALQIVPTFIHAQPPHLPCGTATDVTNDEIQATVKKTASAALSDKAIRVVGIDEYNVGAEWFVAPGLRAAARATASNTAGSPRSTT